MLCLVAGLILSSTAQAAEQSSNVSSVALEALERLKGIDLDQNPAVKEAVVKILDQVRGTPQFVQIVRDFNLKGQDRELLAVALNNSTNSTGAEAVRLILHNGNLPLLSDALAGTNAAAVAECLGNTRAKEAVPLLAGIVLDPARDLPARKAAVRALARSQEGALMLLDIARQNKLSDDLKLTAALELLTASSPQLKAQAAELLPLPQARDAQPLPPISELATRKGDASIGAEVFRRETVGCSKCHQVNGAGTDFGPNLSEIGAKLAKEAIYESILDPSAGIAFGYEAWQIDLKNGDEVSGLIASETADELAVKSIGGIVTRYHKTDILKRTKQTLSIMPAGLQQTMSTKELVDLVEFLSSLKKAKKD
jgi:putative heme-binding domain-containing protein